MKQIIALFLILVQYTLSAQTSTFKEKPPVFPNCESVSIDSLQACFNKEVYTHIYKTFKMPNKVVEEKYRGEMVVVFKVDTLGQFQVVYADALYSELKEEINKVFSELPKIQPATYNGRKTYKLYNLPIKIPFENDGLEKNNVTSSNKISKIEQEVKSEYSSIENEIEKFENKQFTSQLNIQFTHSDYSRFDRNMNLIGANSHTASKPFLYDEVSAYYSFSDEKKLLELKAETKFERKLWNDHLVQLQGKDYWLALDPIFDVQLGKDTNADFNYTFNNTRGLVFQGGLGKKFNFYSSVFESQGRFAEYVNQYAESLKAWGPDPGVIPGRGIGKRFKTDAYDYPVAEGYLSFTPIKAINVQFGHGKNFIGDGYRSLLLSDVTSPHPFFKLNTKFWKLKYTNTWMWLKDVRDDNNVVIGGAFLTKYVANHYLSLNVTKQLNLGLFESVIWTNTNNRGFDVNYLNPVIFYRAIEFQTGQDAGNAILGASAKYKFTDNINMYSQFILDEFSLSDVKARQKSWKNKYGYQLGLKYFNAFKVDNLLIQMEYNRVRPYTYSHSQSTVELNYANFNQPLAHLWGANFSEAIFIARYKYDRWYADMKLIFGFRGLDYNNGTDNFSYGSNIYRPYDDRPFDIGVEVGQGIKTQIFNGNLQLGYLVNPASNLKLFADITYRDFDPEATTNVVYKNNTVWFTFGVRTDLFNWYFDN